MGVITSSEAQLLQAAENARGMGPLVMINLLRFRDEADYGPDSPHAPCSGREAFQRYAQVLGPQLAQRGAESIWSGVVLSSLIAPEDEHWDYATLIRYPSIDALLDLSRAEEYLAAAAHRTAALLDSRLIVSKPNT